jgi:hypothetical protein
MRVRNVRKAVNGRGVGRFGILLDRIGEAVPNRRFLTPATDAANYFLWRGLPGALAPFLTNYDV